MHSSIHTTCWQSTASIKAWRGRNSAFRIRIKEEGDDSGRAGGQKEGEMKQNECREMTRKERRETVLSRPAWTGREKRLWGEPEIKEDLETGRAAFCFFSWVTVCVWRATADPPRAHFTAQASINYQTSTLDIDRRLGCEGHCVRRRVCCYRTLQKLLAYTNWNQFTQNTGPIDRMVLWLIGKIHNDSPDVSILSTMTESLLIQSTTHNVQVLMETELR